MRRWIWFAVGISAAAWIVCGAKWRFAGPAVAIWVFSIPVMLARPRRARELDRVMRDIRSFEKEERNLERGRAVAAPYRDRGELLDELHDPSKDIGLICDRIHASPAPLPERPVPPPVPDPYPTLEETLEFPADMRVHKYAKGDVLRRFNSYLVRVEGLVDDGSYEVVDAGGNQMFSLEGELYAALPRKGEWWEKVTCPAKAEDGTTAHGTIFGRLQWLVDVAPENRWIPELVRCCYRPVNLGQG